MLKKDEKKLLKVKAELEKFQGTYLDKNNRQIQKKSKYIVSLNDFRNIAKAYNEIVVNGHTETIFSAVKNIFEHYKYNVKVDINNPIGWSITL